MSDILRTVFMQDLHKMFYSISEVSELIDEEQHVLRYWEREFTELKPKKNAAGNRIYSDKDIGLLRAIKLLLRRDRLSVQDAKTRLSNLDLAAFVPPEALTQLLSDFANNNATDNQKSDADAKKSPQTSPLDGIALSKDDARELCEVIRELSTFVKNL